MAEVNLRQSNREKRRAAREARRKPAGCVPVSMEQLHSTLAEGIEQGLAGKAADLKLEETVATMVERVEQAFDGKLADMKLEQSAGIDEQAIGQVRAAVVEVVNDVMVSNSQPQEYRIENIVTDRKGNILSASIKPVDG